MGNKICGVSGARAFRAVTFAGQQRDEDVDRFRGRGMVYVGDQRTYFALMCSSATGVG